MPSSARTYICFLHGVTTKWGPPVPGRDTWKQTLEDTIALIGQPRPSERDVELRTIEYRHVLRNLPAEASMPERIKAQPRDRLEYEARRAAISAWLSPYREQAPEGRHVVHDIGDVVQGLTVNLSTPLREQARRYEREEKARAAVVQQVLQQLPKDGHIVLIAHSLGSVVALDVIPRLPPSVRVSLITLGSPLSRSNRFGHVRFRDDAVPTDRLRSWVNVYDGVDPVAGGRGLGRRFPHASDIHVSFGYLSELVSFHTIDYYLSIPVVAAAAAEAAYGITSAPAGSAMTRATSLAASWDLDLLACAYAHQVSRTCFSSKPRWRARFDTARRISVERRLADAREHASGLPGESDGLPTRADLLDVAADRVRGRWSDDHLVPLAIGLYLSSPVEPFEVEIKEAHRTAALTQTLNRVRVPQGSLSDHEFAGHITRATAEATKIVRGGGGVPIGGYLMMGGTLVLAATGVGLLAAAPAGLAGAALITSTLATFGPGGMVGGMVMLALGSSVGTALLTAGAVGEDPDDRLAALQFAAAMTQMPPERLEAALVGWVACLRTQELCGFSTWAEPTRNLFQRVLAEVTDEENVQKQLQSGRREGWTKKRELLERTMKWLDETYPAAATDVVDAALRGAEEVNVNVKAIERRVEAESVDATVLPLDQPRG